jgi:hypothetical protein
MGAHVKVMHHVMNYDCIRMPNRRMFLKPKAIWDGSQGFQFVIIGRLDSDYMKELRDAVVSVDTLCSCTVHQSHH